jgi:hypothetical protein
LKLLEVGRCEPDQCAEEGALPLQPLRQIEPPFSLQEGRQCIEPGVESGDRRFV